MTKMPTDKRTALVDKAAHSVKWAILYNLVPRLITPFSTLILAKLLTPSDFGLVAIATLVVSLANVVIDSGLGKALIQIEGDVLDAASAIFWANLIISLLLYWGLWFASPLVASAYKNTDVVIVIRIAALSLPLSAMTSSPRALLRRRMQYNRLFWIYSSFLIIQAILSVIFAIVGFGVWSIIWGQLIGSLISTFLSYILVDWRLRFQLHWPTIRPMIAFSLWLIASGFLDWALFYTDNVIAGLFLGVQGLGIYVLGFNLAVLLPNFLVTSLGDVAYPAFSRMQNTPREIGTNLLSLQRITGSILLPIAFGLSAVAPTFVKLLYGQKWPGLGFIIAILVIMPGLGSLWTLNANAYQAAGRADVNVKLSSISLLIMVILLSIAGAFGLTIFTITRFIAAWSIPIGHIFWGSRILKFNVRDQLRTLRAPLLISAVMYLIVTILLTLLNPFAGMIGWLKLAIVIFVGGLVYIFVVRKITPDLWTLLIQSIRRVIFK